jgi:addiction module RelB/DinJ family antitoxin
MNTASIFIKTEPKIKEEAKKTAEELGFSLSSILNAFLRQFVKTKTITFSTKELDEVPTPYMIEAMKQAEEADRSGRMTSFASGEEALSYVRSLTHDKKEQRHS